MTANGVKSLCGLVGFVAVLVWLNHRNSQTAIQTEVRLDVPKAIKLHLRSKDVQICKLRLGMTENEVVKLKGPASVRKDKHLSYVTRLGAELVDESMVFDDGGRLESISGCDIEVSTSPVHMRRGQLTKNGKVLLEAFGAPDTAGEFGYSWTFQDFSLVVLVEANEIKKFSARVRP